MGPKFAHFTADEEKQVKKIIDRAMDMGNKYGVGVDPITMQMDLAATRSQMPLRLQDLAEAEDFDFAHDVFGIRRHINRKTGIMGDCFVPRMAR